MTEQTPGSIRWEYEKAYADARIRKFLRTGHMLLMDQLIVYCCWKTRWVWPSLRTLGELTKINANVVKQYLRDLFDVGLLDDQCWTKYKDQTLRAYHIANPLPLIGPKKLKSICKGVWTRHAQNIHTPPVDVFDWGCSQKLTIGVDVLRGERLTITSNQFNHKVKSKPVTKAEPQEEEPKREDAMDREDLHEKAQKLIKDLAKKKGIPPKGVDK